MLNLFPWFSFTLTIPPLKKVYFNKRNRTFKDLIPSHQHKFMEDLLVKVIKPLNFSFIDWIYEFHEEGAMKGNLHIHGYCQCQNISNVEELVKDFYTFNRIIGLSMKSYNKVSNIQQTLVSKKYWLEYIEKNQDKIIFRSRYRQQIMDTCNLDGKPCVFIEQNDTASNHSDLGDYNTFQRSYDFVGKNNKFTIDI